jgi:twinkle protein
MASGNDDSSKAIAYMLPCTQKDCGSSDAVVAYDDGHHHCFSCGKHYPAGVYEGGEPVVEKAVPKVEASHTIGLSDVSKLKSSALITRGIDADIAEKYGVKVEFDTTNGQPLKYYLPYYRDGDLTGYKVRPVDRKEFFAIGSTRQPELFGQQLAGDGGRLLIITEGEFDAMASAQMLKSAGKNYKVVSLPQGANCNALRNHLEWLEKFDTIVLNFDNDKKGKEARDEAAELFTPGKVKFMELPEKFKDANEMLQAGGKPAQYLQAIFNAKVYRPDGVVSLADAWDTMFESDSQESLPYPWAGLNELTYGIRKREIVTLTSGSGMGKSAVTRELSHWLLKQTEDNIGVLALEESVSRTAWGIVSVEANLPLSIREERKGVGTEDVKKWFDATLGTGRIFTLDHFGSTSEDSLLSRVRYMIKGLGCQWVILDHLSIVVSAMDEGGDERRTIDSIMTKLRQLVEETGAGLILVSHLKRTSGDKGHEQGHEVSLAHLRGSQAIAQLSDMVIALERNQQATNKKEANLTKIRVLKNRYAGLLGIATHLFYNRDTGRLEEVEDVDEFLGIAPEETEGNF